MRVLAVVLVAVSIGCGADPASQQPGASAAAQTAQAQLQADRDSSNPNPMLYPVDARPFGREIERWAELLWAYIYKQPFDDNPFFDPTGALCGNDQGGPVWFLPSIPGAALGNVVTRSCTIPQGKAIMLQLMTALNDYPCPDPTFQPAPGQSLYDFLIQPLKQAFDNPAPFVITVDGVAIVNPLSYRFTSDDLFYFKGDPSMAQFDSCVTGKRQPGVVDGFYFMFKPMPPGQHTIVAVGQDMAGDHLTFTENLTIQ